MLEAQLNELEVDIEDNVDIELNEEIADVAVDSYGTQVDPDEVGLTEDYNIVDDRDSFINSRGEISIIDTEAGGDYFSFDYIDIRNICVVTRIRQNKNVDDLVRSIKSTGLLEPIIVAPTATDGVFVVLNGFRRLIAMAHVGMERVPCVINNRVNTPEIPILEAIHNHRKDYSIKEIIDFIDYLEKEKGIRSSTMLEFLMQMETGDYSKLKDVLQDDDENIVSRLMAGQITIAEAFKKLEQRRKLETKEQKELQKAEKVYGDEKESGAENIVGAGEVGSGGTLSEEEIKGLAIMASDFDTDMDDDSRELSEMMDEGSNIDGFQPNKQSWENRETLDPALRKAVLVRDNNTCKCCSISGQEFIEVFDVHHIIEVYLGGDDSIENLITVCTVCHKLIHLYGRGDLYIRPIKEMTEEEQTRFKRIVKLGTIIRKGLALKKIKKDDLKKMDKAETIGRTKPGTAQVAG